MAYAEKRGKFWRARWRGPDGTLESKPGFKTRKAAEDYGRDQEAAIRANTYVAPKAGQLTLTEWINEWYAGLDLELNTMSTYKYLIEVLILPEFGSRSLTSLTAEQVARWEKGLTTRGYTRKTAREPRALLATALSAAVPRHLKTNPAARRRGTGRKGQRRIEQAERAEKTWPTPLEALLFAERCAVLSGNDSDFVMVITIGYTGARWSEALGLGPKSVRQDELDLAWKLYELNARFYRGRPKDGSIRTADIPPFLADLLSGHLKTTEKNSCTCRNTEPPWCPGTQYVFLTPQGAHHRRGNYATRVVRPAADGWYPACQGRDQRPQSPVLVNAESLWPGTPLPPWPAAVAGEDYQPPPGRGVARLVEREGFGRCPSCRRSTELRLDGTLINHQVKEGRCPGSQQPPTQPVAVASWLPLKPDLTLHGLRHGHQTWLDDLGIRYVLQSERMGHEVPGMRGIYSHVTPAMRKELTTGLQEVWEASLKERAKLASRSAVPVLDELLAEAGS